jgi:hypothetical protein
LEYGLLCLHDMSDNHERIAPVTNTNDTSSRGSNPDKIGVYSTDRDTTTASTTSSTSASPVSASPLKTGTTTAGDANRTASAATAASPARWIIPAVVVVLIILALLYLF